MTIRAENSLIHWNYFLALESDLASISRYIEFDEKNFDTFSIELARLLLASASEVDVIAKGICEFLDPKARPQGIFDYQKIIIGSLPEFADETVFLPRYNLKFQPWTDWRKGAHPTWWTSYNKVKHHRGDRFNEANLRNTLHSMGGLLISMFYYYKLKFIHYGKPVRRNDDVINLLPEHLGLLRLNDSYYPKRLLLD